MTQLCIDDRALSDRATGWKPLVLAVYNMSPVQTVLWRTVSIINVRPLALTLYTLSTSYFLYKTKLGYVLTTSFGSFADPVNGSGSF